MDPAPSLSLALDARADISPKAGLRCVVCNELKAIQFNWCLTCYEVIVKSLDELEVAGYNEKTAGKTDLLSEKLTNLDDIGTPPTPLPGDRPC